MQKYTSKLFVCYLKKRSLNNTLNSITFQLMTQNCMTILRH